MPRRRSRPEEVGGRVVQPVLPFSTGGQIKWAVLWEIEKGKKGKTVIIRKDCDDLTEAVKLYNKVVAAGRSNPTLLSANVGFPPPVKFQRKEWRCLNPGEAKSKQKWVKVLVIMEKANYKGIFWCPYCREFRRFGGQKFYYVEGRFARHPNKRGMLACPMCGISHRDYHVRNWNPMAAEFYLRESRRRRGNRKS